MKDDYFSPRWSAEICDCSMPMTFDQYSNCSYGCAYCFSAYQRAIGHGKERYLSGDVKSVDVDKVKSIFSSHVKSQFRKYVTDRIMMQWGGLSDPFCWHEKKCGVGLELMRFFREIDYPLSFSTKGTWWTLDDRYLDVFRGRSNWHIKVSIVTLDRNKAKRVEKRVAGPYQRLKAIERLAKLGLAGITLRLRPFLLGITDPTHTELIRLAAEHGADSVSTEFFCLETRSRNAVSERYNLLSDQAGFDYISFYSRNSPGSGYLRLNREIKRKFVDEMNEAADKAGIRFYVSDQHFKERSAGGSCCGVPDAMPYSRAQFTWALLEAKRKGEVTWDEVARGLKFADGFNARLSSACQIARCNAKVRADFYDHTMTDLIKFFWNNPTAHLSPYRYFGGLMRPDRLDENGNIVYAYDKERE